MLPGNLLWKLVNKLLVTNFITLFAFPCVSSEALGVGQGRSQVHSKPQARLLTSVVSPFSCLHANISLGISIFF